MALMGSPSPECRLRYNEGALLLSLKAMTTSIAHRVRTLRLELQPTRRRHQSRYASSPSPPVAASHLVAHHPPDSRRHLIRYRSRLLQSLSIAVKCLITKHVLRPLLIALVSVT